MTTEVKRIDVTRCIERVWDRYHSYQCQRKCGHGPNGEFCKQHDPDAIKKRREAKHAEWERNAQHNSEQSDRRVENIIVGEYLRTKNPKWFALILKDAREAK